MPHTHHFIRIFTLSLAVAAAAVAQPAAPGVSLTLDTAFTGRTGFEARGASAGGMSVSQTGARISMSLPTLDQRWQPTLSLRYRVHHLERDAGTPLPEKLSSLGLSLSAIGRLAPEWSGFFSISPGFANADSGFSSGGFGIGAIAVVTRNFSTDFSGGLGLRFDSLAGGSRRLMPVASMDWVPAPGWRAFLGFPRTGVTWRRSDALAVDFVAEADFGSFYVTDDPLPAGPNKPPLNRTRLEYQAIRIGPALTWQASPAFSARLGAGFVPVLSADYEQRDFRVKSADTAGFASLELTWRL